MKIGDWGLGIGDWGLGIGMISLLLHQVYGYTIPQHIGDTGVLLAVELDIHPESTGLADGGGPEIREALFCSRFTCRTEVIPGPGMISKEIPIRMTQVQLTHHRHHSVRYGSEGLIVIFSYLRPHVDQLLPQVYISTPQQRYLLRPQEAAIAEKTNGQVFRIVFVQEGEQSEELIVCEHPALFRHQLLRLSFDIQERILLNIATIPHPLKERDLEGEIVVIGTRRNSTLLLQPRHIFTGRILTDGKDGCRGKEAERKKEAPEDSDI